jgi:5'-3' exonuclease
MLNITDFGLMHYNNMPTGGIFGCLNSLKNIVQSVPKQDLKIIVVWDGKRSKRRLEVFPEYKQNRDKMHDEEFAEHMMRFNTQQKILRDQFLPALGVCSLTNIDREGDDMVYMVCSLYRQDHNIFVISEDKDMLQLIAHFPAITVYRPIAKQTVNAKNFEDQFFVKPNEYLIYKALKGDTSDNIPGVPLIGPKTAQKVLKESKPRDFNEFFIWVKGQFEKEAAKHKETRIAGIYRNWGVFTRNLELIDLSREEFTNHEQVEISNVIDNHKVMFYEDYFIQLCETYGFEQFLRERQIWKIIFSANS